VRLTEVPTQHNVLHDGGCRVSSGGSSGTGGHNTVADEAAAEVEAARGACEARRHGLGNKLGRKAGAHGSYLLSSLLLIRESTGGRTLGYVGGP